MSTREDLIDRNAYLEEELRDARRCNLRLVHRFLSAVQTLESALNLDGRLVSNLETWAMTWDIDPDEWRGFLAAHPLPHTPSRPQEILGLFEQFRALAAHAQERDLEELLATLETIWTLDNDRLGGLLAPATSILAQIRAELAADRADAETEP